MRTIFFFSAIAWLGLLLPLSAYSDDHQGFEAHKANILKKIDERMTKLTEHRACVSASTNQEGIKTCHDKMREWMKEHRDERMEHRKERGEKKKSN